MTDVWISKKIVIAVTKHFSDENCWKKLDKVSWSPTSVHHLVLREGNNKSSYQWFLEGKFNTVVDKFIDTKYPDGNPDIALAKKYYSLGTLIYNIHCFLLSHDTFLFVFTQLSNLAQLKTLLRTKVKKILLMVTIQSMIMRTITCF